MRKQMDPRKQFSKWLARFGSIIWGIYAFAILGLIAYRPEVAMACVWLTLIMTCNKALDTVSYTRNSVTEKILLAGIERTKFEFGLKGIAKNTAVSEDDEIIDEDEEGGEG